MGKKTLHENCATLEYTVVEGGNVYWEVNELNLLVVWVIKTSLEKQSSMLDLMLFCWLLPWNQGLKTWTQTRTRPRLNSSLSFFSFYVCFCGGREGFSWAFVIVLNLFLVWLNINLAANQKGEKALASLCRLSIFQFWYDFFFLVIVTVWLYMVQNWKIILYNVKVA